MKHFWIIAVFAIMVVSCGSEKNDNKIEKSDDTNDNTKNEMPATAEKMQPDLAKKTDLSSDDQTEEIINQHFKARGQDRLSEVKILGTKGSFTQGQYKSDFFSFISRPGKYYFEGTFGDKKFVQVFDGEHGWAIKPWIPDSVTAIGGMQLAAMKEQANMDGQLHNWKSKYLAVNYIGEGNVRGKPAYILNVKRTDGNEVKYFIGKTSFLVLKTESTANYNGQNVTTESFMLDHKKIDGIFFPFRYETVANGSIISEINVKEITIDPEIDKSIFKKP